MSAAKPLKAEDSVVTSSTSRTLTLLLSSLTSLWSVNMATESDLRKNDHHFLPLVPQFARSDIQLLQMHQTRANRKSYQ